MAKLFVVQAEGKRACRRCIWWHAFAVENGICLAQQAADAKSNEITAIPELLKLLDLTARWSRSTPWAARRISPPTS